MSDDDSLFSRAKRTVTGPTATERAERLKERASNDPGSFDGDDIDTLVGLLDEDDPEVVTDALYALESVAEERPELVSGAAPAVVADLSNRPADEWSETTIREMSDEFWQDLARGAVVLTLARDDPAHLDPAVEELASKYADEGALEPQSLLALAHVVAAAPNRTDLSPEPFVEWVATELEAAVESDSDELQMRVAETTTYVELLADLGGEDARETLELAEDESDDEEVVRTADRALDRLSGGA